MSNNLFSPSYNLTSGNSRFLPENNTVDVPRYERYVDIDSTFRNRVTYPNAADFVLPITSVNNDGSAAQAQDPVVDGVPSTGSTLPPGSNVTQAGSTTTSIVLGINETAQDNYYINAYLQIGTEFRQITQYDGPTQTATVSPGFTAPPGAGTVYYTRRALPALYVATVSASPAPTTTTFAVNAVANLAQSYPNGYVMFEPTSSLGATFLSVFRILTYNPATRVIVLSSPLPSAPVAGDTLEIDNFSVDNAKPFQGPRASGTSIQNAQFPVAGVWEIDLLWLSVPNAVTDVGYGGQLSAYSHIYVQLYNEALQQASQVLYSNNPVSSNALFSVPVNEYGLDRTFITLKDAKQKQTVSLRLDQDLRFRVTLPSGEVITFQESDFYSPNRPNPDVQFAAVFGIKSVPNYNQISRDIGFSSGRM